MKTSRARVSSRASATQRLPTASRCSAVDVADVTIRSSQSGVHTRNVSTTAVLSGRFHGPRAIEKPSSVQRPMPNPSCSTLARPKTWTSPSPMHWATSGPIGEPG